MIERKYEIRETNFQGLPHICVQYGAMKQYVLPETFTGYKEESEKTKRLAGAIIRDFPNYLYADDRADMMYILSSHGEDLAGDLAIGMVRATREQLGAVMGRAVNLEQAGIPPMFTPEMESVKQRKDARGFTYTHYPTLDAIITIFSRNYLGSKYDLVAGRTNAHRIQFFRDYALRESWMPKVRQEMIVRVDDIFSDRFQSDESRAYVLESVGKGFDYLAKELSLIPRSSHFRLEVYSPEKDSRAIVSQPFWYTQYESSSVPFVLSDFSVKLRTAFLQGEKANPKSLFSEFSGLAMTHELFPDTFPIPELIETKTLRDWKAKKYADMTEGFVSKLSGEMLEVFQGPLVDSLKDIPLSDLDDTLENICKTLTLPANRPIINERILKPAIERAFVEKIHQSTCPNVIINYLNATRAHRISRYPQAQLALGKRLYEIVGEVSTKRVESFSAKASNLGLEEGAIDQARKIYNIYKSQKSATYSK